PPVPVAEAPRLPRIATGGRCPDRLFGVCGAALERRDARPECFVRWVALLRELDDLRRSRFGNQAHHFLDDLNGHCLAPAHESTKLVFHVPSDLARTVGVTVRSLDSAVTTDLSHLPVGR